MIQDILQTIPDHVTLVAATKGRSAEEIMGLIDAGISHIGENYVQQAKEKHGHVPLYRPSAEQQDKAGGGDIRHDPDAR